jgi:hypothetical protein
MAIFVNDTFTGSGVVLTSHTGETGATWTAHSSSSAAAFNLDGSGNLLVNNGISNGIYYASGVPSGAAYDVTGSINAVTTLGSGDCLGVAGRIDTAANTYYRAYTADSTGTFATLNLDKVVAGTVTNLVNTFGNNSVATDLVLSITDASKVLKLGGTTKGTSSDNAITAAGRAGIYGVYATNNQAKMTSLSADGAAASTPSDPAFGPAARRSRGLIMRRRAR